MKEFKKIIGLFLIWRVALFAIAFLATFLIPKFGARFPYFDYLLVPTGFPSWIWGFANFDGVHYIRLAMMGYRASEFSQAFFPLYPILIGSLSLGDNPFLTGFLLSNIFFVGALYVFYRLICLDYTNKIAFSSLVLLLVFPTSFYFGALYSESLFLFLLVSSLFMLRKKNYLGAGLYGGLAAATRLIGLLIIPVIIIEFWISCKKGEVKIKSEEFLKMIFGILTTLMGFLLYIYYLKIDFHSPWMFLSSQPFFGAGRSETPIILLPQVLVRYYKMLTDLPILSLTFFTTITELIFTVIPLALLIIYFKKIRFSYWVFMFASILIPTMTGTLSSMPRYALMSFLILPVIVYNTKKIYLIALLSALLGSILVMLFTRGYWVA